jgi:hypothetical protein
MAVRFKAACVIAAQLLATTPSWANCVVPKTPGAVPDGSSASIDEMNSAKSALEKYQSAVKEYLACVDGETKAKIAALGSNAESIRQLKLLSEKRVLVIQDELQKQADSYTEQMRSWKLTNRQ